MSASAQKEILPSDYTASVLQIDAVASEWKTPFRFYDGNTKLEFDFKNNQTHLFVYVRTADEIGQLKILKSGLDLSINSGKKNNSLILFPIPTSQKEVQNAEISNLQQASAAELLEIKQHWINGFQSLRTKGFPGISDGVYPIQSVDGIQAAIRMDENGRLNLEYAIPFALLESGLDLKKPLPISLTLNSVGTPPASNNNPAYSDGRLMQNSGNRGIMDPNGLSQGGGIPGNGMNLNGGNNLMNQYADDNVPVFDPQKNELATLKTTKARVQLQFP